MDQMLDYKQRYSYNPISWLFYLRNKYCPYIRLSIASVIATLLIIYLSMLLFVLSSVLSSIDTPWEEINLSQLIITPWMMKGVSGFKILAFYFCLSAVIFLLREFNRKNSSRACSEVTT
jgi:hypothetical protein